ncbi:MAG TPA: hypothetical protein VIK52_07720, partial [Opitutaceae bacterium]
LTQLRSGEVDAENIVFQIVDGLVEESGAESLDLFHARECTAQVTHVAGGLSLLHAFVLAGALTDGVIDQGHDLALRLGESFRFDPGIRRATRSSSL